MGNREFTSVCTEKLMNLKIINNNAASLCREQCGRAVATATKHRQVEKQFINLSKPYVSAGGTLFIFKKQFCSSWLVSTRPESSRRLVLTFYRPSGLPLSTNFSHFVICFKLQVYFLSRQAPQLKPCHRWFNPSKVELVTKSLTSKCAVDDGMVKVRPWKFKAGITTLREKFLRIFFCEKLFDCRKKCANRSCLFFLSQTEICVLMVF